jgi:hypothetical protein
MTTRMNWLSKDQGKRPMNPLSNSPIRSVNGNQGLEVVAQDEPQPV